MNGNAAQADYWNDTAGPIWVDLQAQLDRQIGPLGDAAIAAPSARPGERILDVGCGCGETSVQIAALVGPIGSVTSIDISRTMLAFARSRPLPAEAAIPDYREADAQTADLGAGAHDAAFSRFGVMFFDDPGAAFANIRRALKADGRLAFVCWRALADNPMMGAPLEAAGHLLPPGPPTDPSAPGPFAFADAGRLRGILESAGFSEIAIDPFDTLVGGMDLEAATAFAQRVGPLASGLREHPELAAAAAVAVRERLSDYLRDGVVMFPAAVWIVTARTSPQ